MSRAFVKEGDQEESVRVPQRAALSDGVLNYVTAAGKKALYRERELLEKEIHVLIGPDEEHHRPELTMLKGKLSLLQERINTARIIESSGSSLEEVRFGATVTYRILPGNRTTTFQIVGVDEANIKEKKIAFVSPVAQAMMGHKAGEEVSFLLGNEWRKLKILKVE